MPHLKYEFSRNRVAGALSGKDSMIFVKKVIRRTLWRSGFAVRAIKIHDISTYLDLYGEESIRDRRFYNIAAGGHFDFGCGLHHPCWTNIDLDRPWKRAVRYDPLKDISHDLQKMETLPIDSDTAELVHSRFCIEHITDEAAQVMFNEVYRILKTGGLFRVITPNADLDYRALKNHDLNFYNWLGGDLSIEQAFLTHIAANASTKHRDGVIERITNEELRDAFNTMDREKLMNFCTSRCSVDLQKKHRGDHINWWNLAKLNGMLAKAGFNNIYLSCPEQSASVVMRNEAYFDNVYNRYMLFMEVRKN
jgi:SAM-dependent methyltransferase